ncbi:MAG: hypothetical protein ACR5LG_11330 [Sodalis sp. (in: enterobacteria)]|uniref:hypothetical protein n=1 Tax=Sodalis sp. (in: enterobacteria) TaxID=1898979 RepID=UPI003F2F7BCD
MKQSISRSVREQLANDSQTAIGETAPPWLLIDMWRLSGESVIDGRPVFNGVSRMTEEEITDATHGLYQKLTPQQLAALVEVSSQSGFADVHQGLASFPNDFIENFVLGGGFLPPWNCSIRWAKRRILNLILTVPSGTSIRTFRWR